MGSRQLMDMTYQDLPDIAYYKYLYLEGLINEFIPLVQSERKRLDIGWKDEIDLRVYTDDPHLTNAFYIFSDKIIDRCKLRSFRPSTSKENFMEAALEGKGPSDLIHKVAFKVEHV